MSEGPTASYDGQATAGKVSASDGRASTDAPRGDDPRFDVDDVMDRALAANEMARDGAIRRAMLSTDQAAALVVGAAGVHFPEVGGPDDFLVNPIDVARALRSVGLLAEPPVTPVSVLAAQLAGVATRRGNAIIDALAVIETREASADVIADVRDILCGPAVGRVLPDVSVALMTTPPADDKAHIRDRLDLDTAEWIRADAEGVDPADCVEYAFIAHTDGVTYTAMRKASGGVVLVFTPAEWDAFVKGARDGEFDPPAD